MSEPTNVVIDDTTYTRNAEGAWAANAIWHNASDMLDALATEQSRLNTQANEETPITSVESAFTVMFSFVECSTAERIHAVITTALTLATQRAEAAEAERDAFNQMSDGWKTHADSIVAELVTTRAERDALRKDAARLDHMETLREVWSRRPMRAVTGSEWSMVHEHPIDYTPTLREALDAALAVQPTTPLEADDWNSDSAIRRRGRQ